MISADVIIPVYRPDEKLNQLLDALKNQTLQPERIILVHTGPVLSGELKLHADIVIEYFAEKTESGKSLRQKDVRETEMMSGPGNPKTEASGEKPLRILCMIPEDEFDHGGSRNLGASLSQADVMIFMTQDAVPADEFLIERLVCALESAPVCVAYARQLPGKDCRPVERYIREFNYPDRSEIRTKAELLSRGIKTFCNSNVCAAYRRELFDRLGGFENRTIFNEDMLFAAKAVLRGYGIAYLAEARVYHSHNLGLFDQFHRNFDNAVSQADHPEIFSAVSSEREGVKLIRYCLSRMRKDGCLYLAPYFLINCAFRYAGFFLGKRYRRLPLWLVKRCSLNKRYWKSGKYPDK